MNPQRCPASPWVSHILCLYLIFIFQIEHETVFVYKTVIGPIPGPEPHSAYKLPPESIKGEVFCIFKRNTDLFSLKYKDFCYIC